MKLYDLILAGKILALLEAAKSVRRRRLSIKTALEPNDRTVLDWLNEAADSLESEFAERDS